MTYHLGGAAVHKPGKVIHPMTCRSFAMLRAAICMIAAACAAPLQAQQDCADIAFEHTPDYLISPDCKISWVDNNRLQTITWRNVPDDFWPASIEQTPDGTLLTASDLPALFDVDQDGWRDLVNFTPVGMVNGAFDVFFYSPQDAEFKQAKTLSGHTLEQDKDGYIVDTHRSGPAQVMRFFTVVDQDFTFEFEINPYALTPQQTFSCDISARDSGSAAIGAVPDNSALLAYYGDPEPAMDRVRRSVDVQEWAAETDRVPSDTVFYCRLEDGTNIVTISAGPTGMTYAFGPIDRNSVDLVMERSLEQLRLLPDNGAGSNRFGEIVFSNGPVDYTASYSYSLYDQNGALLPSEPDTGSANPTFQRSLTVVKDGDFASPVFAKDCMPGHAFDAIVMLPSQ